MCVRCVAVPNMPRVGGTIVSLTWLARQTGRSSSSSSSLSSLHAMTTRSTSLDDLVERAPCSSAQLGIRLWISAWMSGKSSSLRTTAWASGPSPTMSTRCGGVILRQSPRRAARKQEPEPQHRAPDQQPVVGAQVESRERGEQQGQERGAAERPHHEPRQLVDRQVAERPVVAVVEAGELGRDDPDRRGEDEQQRGGRAAPPETHEDGCRGDRQEVPQREHPPQERLRVVARREAIGDCGVAGAAIRAPATISSSLNSLPPPSQHWARLHGTFALRKPLLISLASELRMRVEAARLGEVASARRECSRPRSRTWLRWPTGSSRVSSAGSPRAPSARRRSKCPSRLGDETELQIRAGGPRLDRLGRESLRPCSGTVARDEGVLAVAQMAARGEDDVLRDDRRHRHEERGAAGACRHGPTRSARSAGRAPSAKPSIPTPTTAMPASCHTQSYAAAAKKAIPHAAAAATSPLCRASADRIAPDDRDENRAGDEQEADDSQLGERLEIERVRELARDGERAVLEPPGLPGAGSAAVERMRPELGDRRAPELPAPAAGAAHQMVRREGRRASRPRQRCS